MGTSSVARFIDDGDVICAIYKHCDGGDFGKTIAAFAKDITIVNGIPLGNARVANGMGCFAAQLIADIKTEPGDVYMCHPENEGDYTFTVSVKNGKIQVKEVKEHLVSQP